MKKIIPLMMLLLLFAACEKEGRNNNATTPEEEHVYHHTCFAIKVKVDQSGNTFQNLITHPSLGCKVYLGDACLVKVDTITKEINQERVFLDTIQFAELPYKQTLSLHYSVPQSFEPENIPCSLYLLVSGEGWKVDTEGKRYGDFAPNARVLGKVYNTVGDNFVEQLRTDLGSFNTNEPWIAVE